MALHLPALLSRGEESDTPDGKLLNGNYWHIPVRVLIGTIGSITIVELLVEPL